MGDNKKPLILVTNDDGITSLGIRELISVMKSIGEVVVVAPDKPQSGTGHSITLEHPLRLKKINEDGNHVEYSCSGTPVDCVKLAVNVVMHKKPDLLVSGVNHGSNSSINVIYSGTMSAAMEGALEGIPSFGISLLDYAPDADFSAAKIYAKTIAENVLKDGVPRGTCLNVNIPALSKKNIKGVKVCRQANGNWLEEFDERKDPYGNKYYWLTGVFKNYDKGADTDEWALKNGYVSVVPVQYDLTAHDTISVLNQWSYE
ncbi:MAG TPA: 5'/3'-nucleotidase SurE [Flavobacteriales bacterium]|nr:5'/3'-nucleotidase SurE [Flavobacteriales bacterium]HIN39992.1 5'/3'-nucleotidase SurE [Flavobacteriales bacterium]